jgi:hypothetical protein
MNYFVKASLFIVACMLIISCSIKLANSDDDRPFMGGRLLVCQTVFNESGDMLSQECRWVFR